MTVADKTHLVCVPYPSHSHIGALVKLAKLLHSKGFHITFVNIEHNHNLSHILKARGPSTLPGFPNFHFASLSDCLPQVTDVGMMPDRKTLVRYIQMNGLSPFLSLVEKLNEREGVPPVTCIVSDGFVAFTHEAALRLGLPIAFFWPVSACSFMVFYQFPVLVQKGLTPFKDESYLSNGHMDTVIDWIPGMKDIHLRDLPSYFRTTDPNDMTFKLTREAVERSNKVSANIIHTFDILEKEVLDSLSLILPSVHALGPLELVLSQVKEEEEEGDSYRTRFNIWEEESVCVEWLDSKEPDSGLTQLEDPNITSVIYVNFGSLVQITNQQLIEIGWGLANSQCPFLWIVRPDLVTGKSSLFPPVFMAETKERGLIASWCSQEEVLGHKVVGGFFTHCGWNSIMESLSAGVPMICWPFFGDQLTNSRYLCSEWMVGMEMDDEDAKRERVEKLVRELMGRDKGVKLRKKAMEWKKLAEEATTSPDGSTILALNILVDKLKYL